MNPYMSYRDIPRAERKELARQAYRQTPALRRLMHGSMLAMPFIGGAMARHLLPPSPSFPVRLGVDIACSLIVWTILWETFGRRRLKAEVEKLANS